MAGKYLQKGWESGICKKDGRPVFVKKYGRPLFVKKGWEAGICKKEDGRPVFVKAEWPTTDFVVLPTAGWPCTGHQLQQATLYRMEEVSEVFYFIMKCSNFSSLPR